MSRKKSAIVLAVLLAVVVAAKLSFAQSDLSVTYGSQGIQKLSYKGVVLEDLSVYPSDTFHIFHMKLTDLSGNIATCAQCGWGENHNGRSWNPTTNTWTYSFTWGTISVQFVQAGNTLNMNVTETNFANSGYIVDGAVIFPFVLNFPQLPAGFMNAAYAQLGYETIGPGVTIADFGSGEVLAVDAGRIRSRCTAAFFLPAQAHPIQRLSAEQRPTAWRHFCRITIAPFNRGRLTALRFPYASPPLAPPRPILQWMPIRIGRKLGPCN